jgi:dGTPase
LTPWAQASHGPAIPEQKTRRARFTSEQVQTAAPPESADDPNIAEVEFARDYERVLYSGAFRRLSGVTQVVAPGETTLLHNRLTHSLKVAQTGELIASHIAGLARAHTDVRNTIVRYGGMNSTVVRTACLAHDIGHPPFGHIGETALQEILGAAATELPGYAESDGRGLLDGFEGNAQSFRIVTRLAFRQGYEAREYSSLNLTRATLSAIAKYPWVASDERSGGKKWNAYDDDRPVLTWAMQGVAERTVHFHELERAESKTIEAQIMDWADDIAYAIHDVEDFFRVGLIPLNILGQGGQEFTSFCNYAIDKVSGHFGRLATPGEMRDWVGELASKRFPKEPYIGSVSNRAALHALASEVIGGSTERIEVRQEGLILPAKRDVVLVELLKQLTWYYVIDRASLSSAQRGQQQVLKNLVRELWIWTRSQWDKQYPGNPEFSIEAEPTLTPEQRRQAVANTIRDWRYRNLPPRLVDYIYESMLYELVRGSSDGGEGGSAYGSSDGPELSMADLQLRGIIDYVSSLSETQVFSLGARLSGAPGVSMLESWASH